AATPTRRRAGWSSTARSGCATAGPSRAQEPTMDDPARPAAPNVAAAGLPELPDQSAELPPSSGRRASGPVRDLIARLPLPVQQVLRLLWWTATLQLGERLRERRLSRNYPAWVARYDTIGEGDRRAIAHAVAGLADP